jgi:glucokinase
MGLSIGVLATEHIAVGAVENNELAGAMRLFPESGSESHYLEKMHADEIAERIQQQIALLRQEQAIEAVGIGFPGIIRGGVIEESPNLPQMKGQNLAADLQSLLARKDIHAPVHILNDADATAAGIAATRGHLDKLVRVWTLGSGIGYGHYPQPSGMGEGGHLTVTLDPKENLCQCGGIGHVEGIMGYHAMRRRFLDMEPEEVFEDAKSGDARCKAFVELWHRALAAATANSIHLEGPGKFYIAGPNAKFVQTNMVQVYLHEMVKMTPLQGSALEVITADDEVGVIGAAICAALAASV